MTEEETLVVEVSSSLWAGEPTYMRDRPDLLAEAQEIAERMMKEKNIPPAKPGHASHPIHVVADWLRHKETR